MELPDNLIPIAIIRQLFAGFIMLPRHEVSYTVTAWLGIGVY